MRLVVAAVGRVRPGPDRTLAERYRERASRASRGLGLRGPDVVEVKESRARDASRRVAEEAAALDDALGGARTGTLPVRVVLDGRGRNLSSDALARHIAGWRDGGRDAVGFVIGGADGLAPAILEGAEMILAFGAATWPHQLVRIMLMEQIYRITTILSGHPYHRD